MSENLDSNKLYKNNKESFLQDSIFFYDPCDFDALEAYLQDFGGKYLAPFTQSVDSEARFPKEGYEALRKYGIMGLLVPKEYGGFGGGFLHHAQTIFNLAQFCASTALCYVMHNGGVSCIRDYGSNWLKDSILPKIANGEIAIGIAFSESGHGSHFGKHDFKEKVNGDTRLLYGRKAFVSAAQYSDYYLTYSNSCEVEHGKNLWLVHKESENLIHEVGEWRGLGMRGNNSMPVQYNGVRVDSKWLVGAEGQGSECTKELNLYGLIGFSAVYSGIAMAAYKCILDYTKVRTYSSGETLADIEGVKSNIAEMYISLQSAISLLYDTARSKDRGDSGVYEKIMACRIYCANIAIEVCTKAMKIGGGKAYNKLLPLERYMRDALSAQVTSPTPDMLKVMLGTNLVK